MVRKILNSIKVPVLSGMNRGKQAGTIVYKEGLPKPYYYFERHWGSSQMFKLPKYRPFCYISQDIIWKWLEPRGVELCVGRFSGYDRFTFFIVIPLREFKGGRVIQFDDRQMEVRWDNKPRFPQDPTDLPIINDFYKKENEKSK